MTAPSTYLRQLRDIQSRRRLELARLLRDDPSANNLELAKALHVSRNTIAEDRKFLMSQISQEAKTEVQQWRDDHIRELEKLRESLTDLLIPPEKRIELALKIINQDAKLKGTEAPARSVSTNVNINPEHSQEYLLFREACAGLTEEQLFEIYAMAKALPRAWTPPPIEADFPVKLLETSDEHFS